jgi:hypothetical protein
LICKNQFCQISELHSTWKPKNSPENNHHPLSPLSIPTFEHNGKMKPLGVEWFAQSSSNECSRNPKCILKLFIKYTRHGMVGIAC